MIAVVQKTAVHTIRLALSFHRVCRSRSIARSRHHVRPRICPQAYVEISGGWCTRVRIYMGVGIWRGNNRGGFDVAMLNGCGCVE
jgi:hypothetical protein